jgi:hypothetical protein
MKKAVPFFCILGIIFAMILGKPALYADTGNLASQGSLVSLEDLLSSSLISALKAGEEPAEIQFRDFQFRLTPLNEDLRLLVEAIRRDLDPSVMVETLHLYQKPQDAERTGWTQAELTALYNKTVAISTLQGIQYYSASRGTMRTFYETSLVIDNPTAKRPLPDPSFMTIPRELTLFARQKDLTFGDNFYQYTYLLLPGALVFVQENLSSLNAGIIPAVGKNKLRSVLALLDAGDYLVIYAVSMAKAVSLPGLRDRIGDSFSNRAEAIIKWLVSGADRAFGKIP